MKKTNKFFLLISAIICSGTTIVTEQLPALGGDVSPLCKNSNMITEMAISTEKFYPAICSTGYSDRSSGCYISSQYFYVGQSRKTGESIVLSANDVSIRDPYMIIYKAQNGNYTYQISSSGGYGGSPWTSLSVFNKGKRVYLRKVNSYYGYYDC